ncbi:hypothetical protein [Stieleria mannarensis]|uniref:hypothetical protein n=1 Tax=Stieleria mannarensis TaxID=2755585 RepID=UPI001601B025|nr:hypothetical protein [Rhodopirellula sp. JC639]
MKKQLLYILLLSSFLAPKVFGGVIINTYGNSLTPGTGLNVSVELPSTTDLASYQIELVLSSNTGTAGIDFFFDDALTAAPATGYIFPSSAFFFPVVFNESSMAQRLVLSDFDFSPVDVTPGINNLVANVVVQTSATYIGELVLSVDATTLLLDNPTLSPVVEYDAIVTATSTSPNAVFASSSVVPEPSSLAIALSFLCMGHLRGRARRGRQVKRKLPRLSANHVSHRNVSLSPERIETLDKFRRNHAI